MSRFIAPLRFLAIIGLLIAPPAFAQAASLSIQSLSPGSSVAIGNELTFSLVPSTFSAAPTYSVSDTFSGGTVTSSDVNSSGVFVWIPTQRDAGVHTITVTATDSTGETASTNVQISVSGGAPSLSIQSISPGTAVTQGSTLTLTLSPINFTNPTYSISDSMTNSTVTNGDINSSGYFSWTPQTQDVGTHTFTITARDANSNIATANVTITVTSSVALSIGSISPGTSASAGQTVSFPTSITGFTNPAFSVSDFV